MLRRFVVSFVIVVAAACGGKLATEASDGSSTSSSSSSSGGRGTSSSSGTSGTSSTSGTSGTSGSSGGVSPGVVECPDRFDVCTTPSAPGNPGTYCCVEGDGYYCHTGEDNLDCYGSQLRCDEDIDCRGGSVCCAEERRDSPISSRRQIRTVCLPSCVTGVERVKVCRTDADCDGSACKDWSCGGVDMLGIKTCAPLEACD